MSRWVYGSGDPSLRKITGLNRFLVWRVRKIVEPQAYSQGIGRHNHREVESIARDDLQALSDFMGEIPSHINEKKKKKRIEKMLSF